MFGLLVLCCKCLSNVFSVRRGTGLRADPFVNKRVHFKVYILENNSLKKKKKMVTFPVL